MRIPACQQSRIATRTARKVAAPGTSALYLSSFRVALPVARPDFGSGGRRFDPCTRSLASLPQLARGRQLKPGVFPVQVRGGALSMPAKLTRQSAVLVRRRLAVRFRPSAQERSAGRGRLPKERQRYAGGGKHTRPALSRPSDDCVSDGGPRGTPPRYDAAARKPARDTRL